MYRLGLGALLGRRFALLTFCGPDGARSRLVLTVLGHTYHGGYVVTSAFQPGSQWHQRAWWDPQARMRAGRRSTVVDIRPLGRDEVIQAPPGPSAARGDSTHWHDGTGVSGRGPVVVLYPRPDGRSDTITAGPQRDHWRHAVVTPTPSGQQPLDPPSTSGSRREPDIRPGDRDDVQR